MYGTLTEWEPVQLKCLLANAQSHKAAPSGPLPSSTRPLMTAVCLPRRKALLSATGTHPDIPREGGCCVKAATQVQL